MSITATIADPYSARVLLELFECVQIVQQSINRMEERDGSKEEV